MLTTLPTRRPFRPSSDSRPFLNLETGLAALLFAAALGLQSAFLGNLLVRSAAAAPEPPRLVVRAAPTPAPAPPTQALARR